MLLPQRSIIYAGKHTKHIKCTKKSRPVIIPRLEINQDINSGLADIP